VRVCMVLLHDNMCIAVCCGVDVDVHCSMLNAVCLCCIYVLNDIVVNACLMYVSCMLYLCCMYD